MISTNLKKRILTSLVLITLLFLMMLYESIFLYFLIIIGIFSILEFSDLIIKINKKFFKKLFYNLIFILFIFFFCLTFFILSGIIQLKIILFSLLLTCIASDIGGYVFGKIFRGPKITKISPNKTISGSIGSIVLSCITISGLMFLTTKNLSLSIILTGIITSIFCQAGDLFFSFLKRKAKKKDTGSLLPGHGGILDRIDGILFGIPAGFIILIILFK